MNNTSRQPIYFRGHTIAESALATSRPDDNFFSPSGSKDMPRLPRLGPKTDASPVFYPGTQLRHLMREAFLEISIQANEGNPLPLEEHFMMIQGVPIGALAKELSGKDMSGVIEREDGLRATNPLISLGGYWKFAGTLGVDDWLPVTNGEAVHYVHSKMRALPHQRNPNLVDYLNESDVDRITRIMLEDGEIARKVRALNDQIKVLKKGYHDLSKAKQKEIGDQINVIEAEVAAIKDAKEGPTETLVRPVEGYEAIIPQTRLRSGMSVDRCSKMELGFVLYALRHIARKPYVGAHFADNKGEFSLNWEVNTWGKNRPVPEKLGRVEVGLLRFDISEEGEDKVLTNALALAEKAIRSPKDYGLDFSVFDPTYIKK
ncbi:FlxA-like family protein [Moritella sp. F3]|uniref:FlxA-like family protein n=1 Tax=Moritella sp. F3 TaxID=2718882 RepID=UPI0018E15DAB|nr:FlxA-like family protein [Moritella sp. F3]GIC77626.1 hypothetical protein FMO001_23530 [Moritella sp. F1]GIC82039.1 hypothetical protein FMO003_23200 [Moritella sp. F3]